MTVAGEADYTPEVEPVQHQKVAILDAGAQYGLPIDKQVRRQEVYTDFLPLDTPVEELEDYDAFIISGGPKSVTDPDAPRCDPGLFDLGRPILGICYGAQLITKMQGGTIKRQPEYGPRQIEITDITSPLLEGLGFRQQVLMSHGDSIDIPAPGFKVIASSENNCIAAIADDYRRIYGVQFHPETDNITEGGVKIFQNFLKGIARLSGDFPLEDRRQKILAEIKEKVGDRHVIAYCSGGVDSTIATVLLGEALEADRIHAIHVDTGFMRHGESEAVREALGGVGIELTVMEARDIFYRATTVIDGVETPPLYRVTNPEVKRKIIGDTFIALKRQIQAKLGLPGDTMLLQGTLRPDLIESGSKVASGGADVIVTHHNDTQAARDEREAGNVVEPLKDLHKDEVREIGEMLGLPEEIVWRQPFPGPGLAIRVLRTRHAQINDEFEMVAAKLHQFSNERLGLALLPIRAAGTGGDGRTYDKHNVAAFSSIYKPNWPHLMELSGQVTDNLAEHVNRVIFLFGGQYHGPIYNVTPVYQGADEAEALRRYAEEIEQARQVDRVVDEVMRKYGMHRSLAQVPAVTVPVTFSQRDGRLAVIRTMITPDFYTGISATPGLHFPEEALGEMVEKILHSVSGIDRVAYDLTPKPPGRTEWE